MNRISGLAVYTRIRQIAVFWALGVLTPITIHAFAIVPTIVSAPNTAASARSPYTYDVDASGVPAPGYSLTVSPAGMSINTLTGLIQWMPAAAGTVSVTVQATSTEGSDTQTFDIVVTEGDTLRFAVVGDFGDDSPAEAAVASLIMGHAPDIVVTAGDNSYDSTPIDENVGQYYSSFIGNYVGTYGPGSVPNRFFPSLGNHDISNGGGVAAYLAYFTLPDCGVLDTNTSGNERYYDFVRGPVHFFVINSNPTEPDGRTSTSTQAQWLEAQLAVSESPWQVVCFHHPAYSSSSRHGSDPVMRWPFEEWGADAVFAGHDHVYERLLLDRNGDSKTIPYFVTGNGGRPLYGFGTPLPESVVRYNGDYGAMMIEATDTYMNFKSYSVNSNHGTGGLIDDYTIVVDSATSTPGDRNLIPKMVTLQQNYPNPFTQMTQFSLGLPRALEVKIDVFDVTGRRVYTGRIAQAPGGWSQVRFNGLDNDGRKLPAGVYFFRLNTSAGTAMRKIVIVR